MGRRRRRQLRAEVDYYYALGDGSRREFTLEDALPGFGSQLPDPGRATLVNVFVDGMLQPPEAYRALPGMLRFVSRQSPPDQARIIAQFIRLSWRKAAP